MTDQTMPHEEMNGGPLSIAERRIMSKVDWEQRRLQERYAARAILRNELTAGNISFAALRSDPTRGEVAAKLYDTWDAANRSEAIVETAYSVTAIYEDLRAAMNAQGLATFNERCAEIGKRIVEASVEYVLSCHETDASAVEDDLRTLRRENDRIEAEMRRGPEYQREDK